mmetsp:Transcript_12513/g.46760  ORF Transcript_12513/g.46760 Transcript_12513/m.46760 type:complete len:247 (+) Transcript_12513:946-1686(+)
MLSSTCSLIMPSTTETVGRSFKLEPTAACSCCSPTPNVSTAADDASPILSSSIAASKDTVVASTSASRAGSGRLAGSPNPPLPIPGDAVPTELTPPGVNGVDGAPCFFIPKPPGSSPNTARRSSRIVPTACVNCAILPASRSSCAMSMSRTKHSTRFTSSIASRHRTSAFAAAALTLDSLDSVFTASDAEKVSRALTASAAAVSARVVVCSIARHSLAAADASRAAVSARAVAKSQARSAALAISS